MGVSAKSDRVLVGGMLTMVASSRFHGSFTSFVHFDYFREISGTGMVAQSSRADATYFSLVDFRLFVTVPEESSEKQDQMLSGIYSASTGLLLPFLSLSWCCGHWPDGQCRHSAP